ncbi:hypothetical protein OH784_23660 [Ectobacillus funiculus]|uniref:hypothetical protein n=1 Tax=Ectobacillus funiculus TaxID=137993 RepID=UPI003977F22E
MEIKLDVLITETKTNIKFSNNQGAITISNADSKEITVEQPTVYFLLKANMIVYIGKTTKNASHDDVDFNKIIMLTPPPWEIEIEYLEQLFIDEAMKNGINLVNTVKEEIKIPANQKKIVANYKDEVLLILENFGYNIQPKLEVKETKVKPAKAQHRWSKEVSQIEFFVSSRESKATAIWHKRNEMLLKAGAKMMSTPPLNKDGSLGFAAKMGEKLRSDYADKIKDFVTTEDLVLKSVNEVGLFLYFGGTNSWLELIDAEGKTIDEWTRVD